jgi:hypothetical protein
MQLSFYMTVPPSEDLANMKGLTNVVKCRFLRTAEQMGLPDTAAPFDVTLDITEGVCKMLTSLVNVEQILELVTTKIQALAEINPNNRPFIVIQGLSFGGAISQGFSVLYQLYARHISKTEKFSKFLYQWTKDDQTGPSILFGTAVFGAPRVGGDLFAQQVEDMQIRMHHFVMYSYHETSQSDGRVSLKYDPIAFWPAELSPVGNTYSLIFYQGSDNAVVHRIGRDIDLEGKVCGAVARNVPRSDKSAFKCLHLFPHYQAFFEGIASNQWCHHNHVGQAFLVPEFE